MRKRNFSINCIETKHQEKFYMDLRFKCLKWNQEVLIKIIEKILYKFALEHVFL